jgi:hypothetical protein
MNLYTILSLKWKSAIRHPLFEQTVLFRSVIYAYLLLVLLAIYLLGLYFEQLSKVLLPDETNSVIIFMYSVPVLFSIDFVLKIIFKKNNFQFLALRRFPNGNKSISLYFIVKEIFSLWNCYLPVFCCSYLSRNVYQQYGLAITIILFVCLWFAQQSVSHLTNRIKRSPLQHFPVITHNFFSRNKLGNYILLSTKMIWRSPNLRRSFFSYLLLTAFWFYALCTRSALLHVFSARLFVISLIFVLFPVLFNQFLFSAEAAFFDRLMTMPDFRKILPAKYILYVFFSFVSFVISLFVLPFGGVSFIELTAILLYNAGTVTLLSFGSILFVNSRIELFGSYSKMLANPPSLQSFVIMLIYAFFTALAILVQILFSLRTAICFMLIMGGIPVVLSGVWFKYLYRCFYFNRHEKTEIFRMQ